MTPTATERALAHTAHRLSALDGDLAYQVGVPRERGWWRLDELADPQLLRAWHADVTARQGDRRAAAFTVGGSVAAAAVRAYVLPVLAAERLPLAGIDEIGVHRRTEGWIDVVAWPAARLAVLPDDPAARAGDVEVMACRAALLATAAARLAGLAPAFDALRATLPVSLPALWGGLADSIGGWALWLARLLDLDRRQVWSDARAITDAVAAIQPRLRQRPTPFAVAYRGGQELYQVRATCCLYYRTVAGAQVDGDGYCATCPLRSDTSRRQRLRASLEDEHAT